MLDTVCPGLPSQEGCFRTSRELPRHVGRLASPDKSESHGPQPAERQARDGAGWRRQPGAVAIPTTPAVATAEQD